MVFRFIVLLLHPRSCGFTSRHSCHFHFRALEQGGGRGGGRLFSRLHYRRRDLGATSFSRLSQLPSTLSHEFPLSCLVGASQSSQTPSARLQDLSLDLFDGRLRSFSLLFWSNNIMRNQAAFILSVMHIRAQNFQLFFVLYVYKF